MPKLEVTAAIQYYLDPEQSNISYLGKVYPALPRIASEDDLFNFVPPGTQVGAVIYMFLADQVEQRIALGGQHQGVKMRTYSLTLFCIMKTMLDDEVAEQAAFDTFVDSLTGWIQADRNAWTEAQSLGGQGPFVGTGVVWQWGEGAGPDGGIDIRFEYFVPHTIDGGVMLHQALGHISVCEQLET